MDAIIASASPAGISSAIGIIRMSGDGVLDIARRIFTSAELDFDSITARYMYLGVIKTSNFNDKAFCLYCKAPKSYTGEDTVEFHVHGGTAVISGIIREAVKLGARPALPGEFTRRAFLNGKLTLSEAEGVLDIINAKSEAEVRESYNMMSGGFTRNLSAITERLTSALAFVDAVLDYPEELSDDFSKPVSEQVSGANAAIKTILSASENARFVKFGMNVVIAGLPNVGKSSLMNALLKDERAIVTDIPGTTRDALSEQLEINGMRINLTDTAGIRYTEDKVEKIGVEKARKALNNADFVIFVTDISSPSTDEELALLQEIKDSGVKYVTVANKMDLKRLKHGEDILISASAGINIESVVTAIKSAADLNIGDSQIITRERHLFALRNAGAALDEVIKHYETLTPDMLSASLKEALKYLSEITGEDASEEIVDTIFSEFCVGK